MLNTFGFVEPITIYYSKNIAMSKNSFFKNLIEKQHFLTQPDAAFQWDEMIRSQRLKEK